MKVKFIFNLISTSGSNHGHVCKTEEVPWIESGMEICFPYGGQSFKIESTSLMVSNGEIMAWITHADGTPIHKRSVDIQSLKGWGWTVCDIGHGQGII